MLQLRHRIGTIVVPRNGGGGLQDPSLKMLLRQLGFDNVIEMDEMESIRAGRQITGLPFLGEHGDLDIRTKLAYHFRLREHTLLFAADSYNIDRGSTSTCTQRSATSTSLFIGMECDGAPLRWLYGPLITQPLDRKIDQSRRLEGSNCERAIDIIGRFNCKEVYVYAMGQEPWLNYIMSSSTRRSRTRSSQSNRLIADCRARGHGRRATVRRKRDPARLSRAGRVDVFVRDLVVARLAVVAVCASTPPPFGG